MFIHGLWIHPQSWASWIEEFSKAGYTAASAPGWPGVADTVQASRDAPDAIADHGIEDVTEHYRQIITGLGALPIIVGHSFGGMIAQKLLGEGRAAAVVAIDAAQIKGVLPLPLSALHSTLPVFKNPANKHRAVSLTCRAVPVQLRQRRRARGVRRTVVAMGDPGSGPPVVRGRRRELLAALPGQGRDRQPGPRPTAL